MKHFSSLCTSLAVLLTMLAVVSCQEADIKGYYISSDYIKSDAQLVLDGNNASITYNVVTNSQWTLTNIPSWLTVSPMSGSGQTAVTITATDNPSALTERSGQMTLRTSNEERTISITQKTAHEFFEADIATQTYAAEGGTQQLYLRTNTNWSVSLSGSPFFSVAPTSGTGNATLTVTCQPNGSERRREGWLDIEGKDSILRIPIIQNGLELSLSLSPEAVTIDATAHTVSIMLDGDAPWTASSNIGWATIDRLTGTGAGTVNVAVAENVTTQERQAIVTFTTTRQTLTCTITQQAGSTPRLTPAVPTVTDIGKHVAKVSAGYSSIFSVTEYGVCYSATNPKPTLEDPHVSFTGSDTSGNFTAALSDLSSLTTYYVTAYARNKVGISYSSSVTFTTTGSIPGEDENPTPNL